MGKPKKDKNGDDEIIDISKVNEDDKMIDDLKGLGLEALGFQIAAEKDGEDNK